MKNSKHSFISLLLLGTPLKKSTKTFFDTVTGSKVQAPLFTYKNEIDVIYSPTSRYRYRNNDYIA